MHAQPLGARPSEIPELHAYPTYECPCCSCVGLLKGPCWSPEPPGLTQRHLLLVFYREQALTATPVALLLPQRKQKPRKSSQSLCSASRWSSIHLSCPCMRPLHLVACTLQEGPIVHWQGGLQCPGLMQQLLSPWRVRLCRR